MRLNEKTYPAYMQLENQKYEYLKIDQMFGENILKSSNVFKDFLVALKYTFEQSNKKYYLTNTFKDAIMTASPKIQEGEKQIKDIPTDCGIIFTDKGFSIYLSNPTDKRIKLLCYGFTKEGVLTTYGIVNNDLSLSGLACSVDKNGQPVNDTEGLVGYLYSMLTTIYFIHNCEIEQKVVQPNKKDKINGQKYFNESKSSVVVLDCKWFTELIRDTPFHVKGHLRWQAHGEKRAKRKLIWIGDFEKQGYTRKATKEMAV